MSKRLITGPFAFGAVGRAKKCINKIWLAEPINDARFIDIVRGHVQFDAVANGKADEAFAHLTRNMREDEMFVRERDPEHGAGKNRHDRSFQLDRFF